MKIQNLCAEHSAMQIDLYTKAEEINGLIFAQEALKVEVIETLLKDGFYWFDEEYTTSEKLANNYKDMHHDNYIMGRYDREENCGSGTVYTIGEVIIENISALLPIIQRYEN